MIYVGIKLLVVTSVCVITTVLTLSLLTSGYLGYMCGVDVVVNSVCVCLMTAYYRDDKYYERLCYLCLCCCPKKYQSKDRMKQLVVENNREYKDTVTSLPSPASSLNPMTIGNDYVQLK